MAAPAAQFLLVGVLDAGEPHQVSVEIVVLGQIGFRLFLGNGADVAQYVRRQGTKEIFANRLSLHQDAWPIEMLFFQGHGRFAADVALEQSGTVGGQLCLLENIHDARLVLRCELHLRPVVVRNRVTQRLAHKLHVQEVGEPV